MAEWLLRSQRPTASSYAARRWTTCPVSRGASRAQIEGARVGRDHRGRRLVQLTADRARADAHRFHADLGFVASHDDLTLSW